VFVGEQGEALSSFEPFRGASSAVVIDAAGKEYPVELIFGANGTYDVAKFKVTIKKSQPVVLSSTSAAEGDAVWLLPYLATKEALRGTVNKAETFSEKYTYYTVRMQMPENGVGMPLFNDEGLLIGLMQQPAAQDDSLSYAVSALFADSLKTSGLSINDPTLRSTLIKKALPDDVKQAQLSLFMAPSSLDSVACAELVEDFIRKFPDEQDGYITRAQLAAEAAHFSDADADMQQALKVADKQDEAHYSYSRLIYQVLMQNKENPYEPWSLDKAMTEAEAAFAVNPLPLYRQQQAYVCYGQKKYAEASSIYETLYNSDLRSPDLFLEAATCKLVQADTLAYLALLDSAVSLFSQPYLKEAAPYILTRAQAKMEVGKYRDAVNDLNDYEKLMITQVNDQFYYLRFQAEQGGRIFQLALNDIAKAIELNPNQELYYAEKASLEVRVGLYDEAIETARKCIAIVPEYSDGHLFLGLALCLKGDKVEGVKSLQRAKELGDPQADELIEKYGK
jgi:Tfp pilus assembly protein PilF